MVVHSSPLSNSGRKPAPAVLTAPLRRLLRLVLLLFGLLVINSCYLVTVSLAGQVTGQSYENYFYLLMFLAHLGLGLLLILPALLFGALHLRRAWRRPNRYAVRAGMALFMTALLLLLSGLILTRFGFFEISGIVSCSIRNSSVSSRIAIRPRTKTICSTE